jgi:hypothetical protein
MTTWFYKNLLLNVISIMIYLILLKIMSLKNALVIINVNICIEYKLILIL